MRWLNRRVVLCLLIVVLAPAPAYAWFEWLDYLSGPGRWYGVKVDVRALCFGRTLDPGLERDIRNLRLTVAPGPDALKAAETGWADIVRRIRAVDDGLDLLKPDLDGVEKDLIKVFDEVRDPKLQASGIAKDKLEPLQQRLTNGLERVRKADLAIASTGIFISLCSAEKRKSFGLEFGVTAMGAPGNDNFANGETIWLTTFTGGVSYRLPLPASRDFMDLGTNAGMYRFYSKGFENFSGWTIEPFVDFHMPTRFIFDESKAKRFFARFSLRAGLVFFPGGFTAEQFASAPSKSDISGREATTSLTVFYRLRP